MNNRVYFGLKRFIVQHFESETERDFQEKKTQQVEKIAGE